jgi:recombinational DNA repair protein RecT
MNTTPAPQGKAFSAMVLNSGARLLDEWVGPERAAEAKGRIMAAFSAAALSARNPADLYACTPASVAQCVAISALTGIMPGTGAAALAYLVPRRARKGEAPQLQYQLSHRGLAALARRAGLTLIAVPVGMADRLVIRDGEAAEHEQDPDHPPQEWDDLRGVLVIVKEGGQTVFRGWVAKALIERRRAQSDSWRFAESGEDWKKKQSTWHQWPVEMAMKAALHYAVSRGWAVIDDTEALRALSADSQADVIDADYREIPVERTRGRAALGLPAPVEEPKAEPEREPVQTVREPGDDDETWGQP